MLILSRKKGESILLNETTEITVLEVSGDKVRIGINAPKEVTVLRAELKQTEEENKNASVGVSPVMLAKMLKENKKTAE